MCQSLPEFRSGQDTGSQQVRSVGEAKGNAYIRNLVQQRAGMISSTLGSKETSSKHSLEEREMAQGIGRTAVQA